MYLTSYTTLLSQVRPSDMTDRFDRSTRRVVLRRGEGAGGGAKHNLLVTRFEDIGLLTMATRRSDLHPGGLGLDTLFPGIRLTQGVVHASQVPERGTPFTNVSYVQFKEAVARRGVDRRVEQYFEQQCDTRWFY